MTNYFCDKCLGYKGMTILGHPHQCPPAWEGTDYESETEDPWQYGITVYAHSPEEAAEKWCQRHDQMGDYDIISNGGADLVRVRKVGSEEEFRFSVVAESEPTYSARTL